MSTNPETLTPPAWNAHTVAFVNGTYDKRIDTGEEFDVRTLADLFNAGPACADKLVGPAFLPSSYHEYDARSHDAQRERGQFVALTADIDSGDHTPKAVQTAVADFVGGAAYLIYSSPHSRPGDRRWRVVVPLAAPTGFEQWFDAQTALFAFLGAKGIETDKALARAGQLVFLPNVPKVHVKSGTPLRDETGKALYFQRCATKLDKPGLDLDAGPVSEGVREIRRRRADDERERERMREEAAKRRANRPQSTDASLIDDFNATNPVAGMLEICGYEQSPRDARDWKSPNQTGETYATRIMDDGTWFSLSQSDVDARVGQQCRMGCFGDAYDLYAHYKHGGDHKAAYRALGEERRGNVIRPSQFNPPEWMAETPPYEEMPDYVQADEEPDLSSFEAVAPEPDEHWPEPVDLWSRFEEPELPTELLPLTIDMFSRRQAAIMGADAAGLAMASLAVCATAIPDCIELQVKRNDPTWREHARLWVALVGPPSRKKTPVFKAAMSPLRTIDNQLMRAFLQSSEEYENLSKDDKKLSPRPKQRRLVISDTTIEAAQEVMMDSPDGVLSEQDELSGWFGSMDRYNTKGGGDRAFWLKAFNGGTYNLNRIGRGAKQIPNLSISLLGGIQPEPMRKFASESVDDGLLQRMLPVILRPSTVGQDIAADKSAADYEHLVADLYGLRNQGHTVLHFSDGARAIRDKLEAQHLELSMALETVSPKLAAHYGKYDGIFARLCLIFHCIDSAYRQLPLEISEDTAGRVADFMAEFIRPSAIAFYAGVLGMSAGHEELISLASLIVAKGMGEISTRDVQRSSQSMKHVTSEQFRQIAEKLEAFGWVERGEPKPKSNTPRWIVNPRVFSMFEDRAEMEMARRNAAREALRRSLGSD